MRLSFYCRPLRACLILAASKRLLQWKGAKEKNATDRSALRYLVAVDDDIHFSFLHYFVGRCDSN